MSLDDSIQENDVQTDVDGLIVLMDKDFHRNNADKVKIGFVEGQGITVEFTGSCPLSKS